MNISLPIGIFEHRSELYRNANLHSVTPHFLEPAANLTDPLEQIKLVITAVIARIPLNMEQKKPFNPILGETFQGFINGCPIYYEQISHHPPIMSYLFLGKGYTISGTLELIGSASLNQMRGCFLGLEKITLAKTGNEYYIKFPKVNLEGLMYGKRLGHHVSNLTVFDPKNRLYAKIKFDPEKATFMNVFHKRKLLHDAFIGEIFELRPEFCEDRMAELRRKHDASIKAKKPDVVKVLSSVTGNVLDRVFIDEKEYFNIEKFRPYRLVEAKNPLPSDCTYRLDGLLLLQEDFDNAQVAF
eukprot:TRINITY_DN9963_c0_g1_i2.p1 TRINITY_DN9963_c0_g1~~TRINITY_DN9963_c0_g1_i2.p1  ORF type:complete len:299 (-),score=62.04 TRINITY_DN9963_c0_g1_i2:337-1233(-)